MKNSLLRWSRCLIFSAIFVFAAASAWASHIVGADLYYRWIGTTPLDQTYQISVVLYGNCGPSSAGAFATLPFSVPRVCIYDGPTYVGSVDLPIRDTLGLPGIEVTPVCSADFTATQCHSTTSVIPGIKRFLYTASYTLPHTSQNWRFVYEGYNGGGSLAGRAGTITNITLGTLGDMQLIDSLNNDPGTNTRGHNSSPVLTVLPVPFFCSCSIQCYNPGAVDVYDTNYISEPSGDSLSFALIAATQGNDMAGPCVAPGGPVTYIAPMSPTSPLNLCAGGSLSFEQTNGEMCFKPMNQIAVVVYNIEEFRNDTVAGIVHKIEVGTMQREMTFTVIDCTTTSPHDTIDSITGLGSGGKIDSVNIYGCANQGTFSLYFNPREAGDTLDITITATGLPPGMRFTTLYNNTDTPRGIITGNTDSILPGIYTFFLTYQDNNCPLTGTSSIAYTVQILPVPTIRDSLITPATCDSPAVYEIFPGGTGKPWTVEFWQPVPAEPNPLDTFLTIANDSLPFFVHLPPGLLDSARIYTSVSKLCAIPIPIPVDTPRFNITGSFVSPSYCGGTDGSIIVHDLHPGKLDSFRYTRNGVMMSRIGFIAHADSTDTLPGLIAGTYMVNIVEGLCVSDPLGPEILVNPPFTMGTVTGHNPTKCGFCDGIDTLFNLHPGQLDTITYNYVDTMGISSTYTVSHFITADSFIIFSGLCSGTYSNFYVNTAGVCTVNCCSVTIQAPPISDNFTDAIHYGCFGDTVVFTNLSAPPSELLYHWEFGDGANSIDPNPTHKYTNTINDSVTIMLAVTNTKCVDTARQTIYLNNYVHAAFTMLPDKFICQDSLVTFTNTSSGASPITNNPPTYTWIFGDGTTDNTFSPTHVFANSNNYTIKLVAANTIPCYDTATMQLAVDSISITSIHATDTVICRGQSVTFTGIYTSIGNVGNDWAFGDSNHVVNINPVIHAYDDTGAQTVILNTQFRACPNESSTATITVIPVPDLYLGPDQAICPGGNPITLMDSRNAPGPATKWLWNTGDTSNAIIVTQPGYYSAMITVNGCAAFDTVWVQKDCYMDIPNVFTPNGDGTNDYFYPRQFLTRGVITFKMDIYNRWGQLIFETTSTDGRGWDGKYNNVAQPSDVYVYMIDATFKDGQIEHHQGNVTLLR